MKKLILLPLLLITLFLAQSASAESPLDVPSPFCLGTSCVPSISPSVLPSSVPSPTIFIGTPSISPSASISAQPSGEEATPSASPEVSPSSSPSGTPSNPAGPVCTSFSQFINNLTSTQSTTDSKVHAKCAPSGGGKGGDGNGGGNNGVNPNNGWLSKFFALLIEILLQLFQLCGVQPINGTPVPSGTPLPSLSLSLPPSGVVPSKATSPSTKPSQSQNQPSQGQNQPSQSQNQPSQAQNQPSQSQNQPSQSQNQPSQGQNQPSQAQAKNAFNTPTNLTAQATSTGTGTSLVLKISVTWTPVTKTTQGTAATPTAYSLIFYQSNGTTGIGGITNTSVAPLNEASKYCTTSTCTQTFSITNSSANTAAVTALTNGTAVVKVYAVATSTIAASTAATATVKKPNTTTWSFVAPANLTEITDPSGTNTSTTLPWKMTVTWTPVTKTNLGTMETPTNYSLAFFQKNGTGIGGIGNISTNGKVSDTGDPAAKFCTSSVCTQTFSAPASAIAALATSGSYVKVSATGAPGTSAATQGKINPWTFQAPPNLKELSSESTTGTTNTWTMTVTWDVPKAIEGGGTKTFAVTPASYGIQFFDGSNKAISGISTLASASCSSTSCTQKFSLTSSSANSASIVALTSGKAYVEVAPKGAPISPASSDAKYTIKDIIDTTCTDFSSEGYECLPGGQTGSGLKHIGGNFDTSCGSGKLCYQKISTSTSSVGSSSVFSEAVDAASSVWNTVTTPIVHVLTSL